MSPLLQFLVLAVLTRIGLSSFQCSTFDSNMGATFDLTDLYRAPDQPPYQVTDGDIPCTTNKIEPNYTYIFNVCGTINSQVPDACLSKKSYAGAVQINQRGTIDPTDDWCYLAGKYEESSTKLTLLSQDDPTKGLALTYYGDACSNHKQRQFRLELVCADKLAAVPTSALEYEACSYTVTMPSVYGCPLECGVANRHLCGGNGHCSYDEDSASARCFCNHGFTGSACADPVQAAGINYSPALLGLIITLFIIVILLAGSLIYMIRQMNAYKEDIANYQVLKGGDDENAVV